MSESSPSLGGDVVFKASPGQVSSDLGGEVVILDLAGSKYYGLDAVGARVWALLQEGRSVEELSDTIVEEYEVDPETCRRDVETLLTGLEARGLVARV